MLHELQVKYLDIILGINNKAQTLLTPRLRGHSLDHIDSLLVGELAEAAIRLRLGSL